MEEKKAAKAAVAHRSVRRRWCWSSLVLASTTVDALRIVTSYFDKGWNAFAQQKDGSIQWIPEQIVGIGEDFHSQVDDGKVKTTV